MNKRFTQTILKFILLIVISLSSGCEQSATKNPSESFDLEGSLIYADYQDIYILDLGTKTTKILSSNETSHIEFSIINNSIYYRGSPFKANLLDIYKVNLDGSGLEQITFSGVIGCVSGSPNGKYLTYVEGETLETSTLFIYDLENKTKLKIGNVIGCPALSPDGKNFAFFVKIYGSLNNLFLYSLEDKTSKELSLNANYFEGVTWSPDGKRILFEVVDNQQSDIYILELQTSNLQRLTINGQSLQGNDFVWSPVPGMISYSDNSAFHLRTLDDSNNEQVINIRQSNIPTWIYHQIWSPDAKYFGYFTAIESFGARDTDIGGISLVVHDTGTQQSMEIKIPGNWITSAFWIYP